MRKKRYNKPVKNEADSNKNISPSKRNSKKNKHVKNNKKDYTVEKIIYPEYVCCKCGKPITDITAAISDKDTQEPIHFDCVLSFLKESENLKNGEEIIYIGNGNFAVAYFENPKIRKNFKIIKLIEWEEKNKIYEWKMGIANLASSL